MAKIMVVDDEPDVVHILKSILEKGGYSVVEAIRGKECLGKLKNEKPDLILLDIMMPDLDGWEVLKVIKNKESTKSIPVAMLTAKALTVDVLHRKDIDGLVDYIMKPFSIDSLLADVEEIIKTASEVEEVKRNLSTISTTAAGEYESVAMLEKLHRNLIAALKEVLEQKKKEGALQEVRDIEEAIERELWLVEVFENRKKEIQRLLNK